MDLRIFIVSGLEETLKCFVCQNYLSYLPVSVCSNNRSICGRCVLPEGLSSLHDTAFQTVVQFLKFPCRYKSEGCFEEFHSKDVPQHEENCPRRSVKCMLDYPVICDWSGPLHALTDHYQREHWDVFLNGEEFEMDLSHILVTNQHWMKVDDKLFMFVKALDLESKKLTCAVYPSGYETDVQRYSCQLSIRSGKTTILHQFDTTSFVDNIFEEVCLQFARKETDRDSVMVKINVAKKETANESADGAKISKLREFLRCSLCGTVAGPSIFRDPASMDVLCAHCNSRLVDGQQSIKVEDKILSTFASVLAFPCKYQGRGCSYRAQVEEIRTHQDACQYANRSRVRYVDRGRSCVKCNKHAESGLKHKIMSLEKRITVSKRRPIRRSRIVQFNNCLFCLVYHVKKDGRLLCSVKKTSSCKGKFGFEIVVYDTAEPGGLVRHVVTSRCELWCVFKKEQVFGKSAKTKFKVRIFKCFL